MATTSIHQDIETALADTERAGLAIVLTIRSVLIGVALLAIIGTMGLDRGLFGASFALIFLFIGLGYRSIVRARRDRIWMRYAFITLDVVLLGLIIAFVPLSQTGDVPQIFVFRVYTIGAFFFLLATAALSLSPGLVLWSGSVIILTLWSAWAWIVWGMEHRVAWSDYALDPTPAKYVWIVLHPDMINLSTRVSDTIALLATALVTAAAVQRARDLLRTRIASERERAEVAEVFGRFVPEEVVETLSHSNGVLPPEERTATVMFIDIEGFTSLSERKTPEEIVTLLDAFFDEVGAIAAQHRGVCISLIGDAALIAFNAPLDNPDHAGCALACAGDLLDRTETAPFAGERLAVRIGIATGPVAAGTVGGQGRRTYTLYGDTVNLAQRLETRNKATGTHLLADGATWEAAGAPDGLTCLDTIRVKGRERPVAIYAPRAAEPVNG